jgi:hypothetical protein
MTNYLPATALNSKQAVENLRSAAAQVGSGTGTGETYLKVDDRSGRMTFGQEQSPFPPNHRMVVGLHTFTHGYLVMAGTKVVERHLVPMVSQPNRPVASVYATKFGQDGAKDVTEITLNSIDEPGFSLVFTAWSVSSANRVRNLLEQAVVHAETPEGAGGFVHPVIVPKSGHYPLKGFTNQETGEVVPARDVHHFDFDIVDWLHTDGKTLLSQHGGAIEAPNGEERAPWDDGEDEDGMTDAERELLDTAGR